MKKILISLSVIAGIAAVSVGSTGAFFSFNKNGSGCGGCCGGHLDLEVDIDGVIYNPLNRPIFEVADMKPGDNGEETLSLHVNKDACGFVSFKLKKDLEFACNEPESLVDSTCGNPGWGQGELNDETKWLIWEDEGGVAGWQCGGNPACGADPLEGDNILNGSEQILLSGALTEDEKYGFGQLLESQVSYYGFAWCLGEWGEGMSCSGESLGNETQGDFFKADMVIKVEPKKVFPEGCPVGEIEPCQGCPCGCGCSGCQEGCQHEDKDECGCSEGCQQEPQGECGCEKETSNDDNNFSWSSWDFDFGKWFSLIK